LIMEWRGKAEEGITLFNPLGWLINHLSCNLALFKDHGVRYVREILVMAEPGPDDALVASTADHLATVWGASVTFVRFVPDSSSRMAVQSEMDYLEELSSLCEANVQQKVVRGRREAQAIADLTPAYDFLLIGARPPTSLWSRLYGTETDKLTQLAKCSVLRLKTPKARTHATVGQRREGQDDLALRPLIEAQCVGARLNISKKEAAFTHFAQCFAATLPGVESKEIEAALWQREKSQNTAVGMKVAMPHATLASIDRTYLGVFINKTAMDFAAADGEHVDVCFVTLGPPSERNHHLQLLARLSRYVLETPLLENLRAAETNEQVLHIIEQCDGTNLDEPSN